MLSSQNLYSPQYVLVCLHTNIIRSVARCFEIQTSCGLFSKTKISQLQKCIFRMISIQQVFRLQITKYKETVNKIYS